MSSQASDPAEFLPRRRPSQERSRRRFDDILRAARALLVEVGFESFTSEQVALRAGVPIGSLYQFFGNKYAIICELDRLDTVNVQAELEKFAGEIPSLDWLELLEKLLDHLAALWRTDPSRRAVWLAMQATPPTRAIAAEHERDLASQVTRILAPLTPGSKISDRQTLAEVHRARDLLDAELLDPRRAVASRCRRTAQDAADRLPDGGRVRGGQEALGHEGVLTPPDALPAIGSGKCTGGSPTREGTRLRAHALQARGLVPMRGDGGGPGGRFRLLDDGRGRLDPDQAGDGRSAPRKV